MAASLSAYWVKFFKGAGFPSDVATKHAVVFSNNRIKPDMLPDLDKPSLKEMGITLMGDMIAILRYAKKVVEETTCERFLVDTEDEKASKSATSRTPIKKIVARSPTIKPKLLQEVGASGRIEKLEKKVEVSRASLASKKNGGKIQKRKATERNEEREAEEEEEEGEEEADKKRRKLNKEDDKVGYTVIMPKGKTTRSKEILKKISDQKGRTVFDRLGDSSVTSTTNLTETGSTTFNITGLGNEVLKRNSSVFNRLGDKDVVPRSEKQLAGILKNGISDNGLSTIPQGILKAPTRLTCSLATCDVSGAKQSSEKSKNIGTMHADYEKSQKIPSTSVRQLVKTTKKIRLSQQQKQQPSVANSAPKVLKKTSNPSSKLASERIGSVPAKARLGLTGSAATIKQVTFDRVAKVVCIKKPGVFSRLGI